MLLPWYFQEYKSRRGFILNLISLPPHSFPRVTKPGTGELRHGTEGWACLETSFRVLGQLLEGCDPEGCRPFLTSDFREMIARSVVRGM